MSSCKSTSKSIKISCRGADSLAIDQILEFQGTLKKITKKNLERLKERILEDGFSAPMFIWDRQGDYMVLDGHQRLKAMLSLREDGYDMPLLPVVYIDADDEKDARRKLLSISNQYGEFELEELNSWISEMDASVAASLRLVDNEIEFNIDEDESNGEDSIVDAEPKMSEADRLQKKWGTELGQVWQLGDHRIMCGDSTDPKHVEHLMDGELADLAFTDPPYGVSYIGVNNPNGREWDMIENDDLRGDTLFQFLLAAFENMEQSLKDDTAVYVWYASSTHIQFETALNTAGFEVKEQLIWNKGMVLGHSDYHWAHKPLLYCKKKGQKTTWHGDRTNKTILRARRTELRNLKKEQLIQILTNLMDNSSNWEIDRDSVKTYLHPTQKPTALAYRAIVNSSADGAMVQDLFSGSGTTIIACENTGRRARVMEFSPGYVAVAIQRWKDVTDKKPELIGTMEIEK